jgi:DNA-binding GntR family transcriptional regulator
MASNGAEQERHIVAEMHRAISDGRLPAGTKLPAEQLADIFNVSRARIRSVLRTLAHDKVVTLQMNRGAFVSQPTPQEARNVFAARRLIEVALAHEVAQNVDAKGIARLREQVAAEASAELGPDRHLELKVSHDFHVMLAQLNGNPVISTIVAELAGRSELITALYQRSDVDLCSHQGHENLVDILERGNGPAFVKAMHQHFDELESLLIFDERQDSGVDLKRIFGRVTQRLCARRP